jgi:hypothetical protein
VTGIHKWSDIRELAYPELPGVPPALFDQALFAASREFCDRSRAWEEDLTIDLVADESEYSLKPKWQASVEVVKDLRINTAAGVTAGIPGNRINDREYSVERSDSGRMARIVLSETYTPTEAVTGGMTLTAILVPDAGEHQLPQWFLQRHYEAIMGMALSDLMTRHEDDAWYNPSRAAYWKKRYGSKIGRARSDVINRGRIRPRGLLEDDDDAERGYYA